MENYEKIKKLLLRYGASEEEAGNFINDLAKLPDEIESEIKDTVEKDFDDPKDATHNKLEEKDFD